MTESRWETLVAAGSGEGWSRAIYLIAQNDGVTFNVLCGSHLVAENVDASTAVLLYNQIAARGIFFAVIDPESQ